MGSGISERGCSPGWRRRGRESGRVGDDGAIRRTTLRRKRRRGKGIGERASGRPQRTVTNPAVNMGDHAAAAVQGEKLRRAETRDGKGGCDERRAVRFSWMSTGWKRREPHGRQHDATSVRRREGGSRRGGAKPRGRNTGGRWLSLPEGRRWRACSSTVTGSGLRAAGRRRGDLWKSQERKFVRTDQERVASPRGCAPPRETGGTNGRTRWRRESRRRGHEGQSDTFGRTCLRPGRWPLKCSVQIGSIRA